MTYSLTHSTFRVIDCEAPEHGILRLSRDSCDLQFPLIELMVSLNLDGKFSWYLGELKGL